MIKTYRYTDEKSDKFWRVIYEPTQDYAVYRWGKWGCVGQSKTTYYNSCVDCVEEVQKKIKEKLAKGYSRTDTVSVPKFANAQEALAWLESDE